MKEIEKRIHSLESLIEDPSKGLPEEIFLFVSRITPLINVDLLIKDDAEEHTLLTWREDGYSSPGWHVPGGIVRFKELIQDRVHAVAATELGAAVTFENRPRAINQVIDRARKNRAHFISLLYCCKLTGPPDPNLKYENGSPIPGQWAWHDTCPVKIIPVHEMYRKYI